MLNFDFAETTRQRANFLKTPPPCSALVAYRTFTDDTHDTEAVFYFNSAFVESKAREIHDNNENVSGINAAALWASLSNESLNGPTEVPELLINFDYIAEELIDAGHGQVRCLACNKIYATSELSRNCGFHGGSLIADYLCPSQHKLLSREVAHFMFARNKSPCSV